MVVFGHSGCFRAKVVVFGQRWLYSNKSGCIQKSGCVRVKVVVFGEEWLHSGKVVVFGKKWL